MLRYFTGIIDVLHLGRFIPSQVTMVLVSLGKILHHTCSSGEAFEVPCVTVNPTDM